MIIVKEYAFNLFPGWISKCSVPVEHLGGSNGYPKVNIGRTHISQATMFWEVVLGLEMGMECLCTRTYDKQEKYCTFKPSIFKKGLQISRIIWKNLKDCCMWRNVWHNWFAMNTEAEKIWSTVLTWGWEISLVLKTTSRSSRSKFMHVLVLSSSCNRVFFLCHEKRCTHAWVGG